jgi:hypothetical protein
MHVSLWRVGALTLAGLAILATPVSAQFRARINPGAAGIAASAALNANGINPNFYLPNGQTLNQAAYNTGLVGQAYAQIPPYALGYNPYPQVANFGPNVNAISAYNPYAVGGYNLSTVGGAGNPYLGGAALATGPAGGGYALSTTGAAYGAFGGFGGPGSYGGFGNGQVIPGSGTGDVGGNYLNGTANLTAATGKYYKDMQEARIIREQSIQAGMDTRRRRLMEEAFYEKMKPTAQTLRDQELSSDLTRARRDPPLSEVWSGKALNDLYRSILAPGRAQRGPSIPLDEDTVKNINLTDTAASGNIGMIKEPNKFKKLTAWPAPLREHAFDQARERLATNLTVAVAQVKDRDQLGANLLKDLRGDFTTLNDQLGAAVGEMAPSQFIEARRFLKQLDEGIRALEDPNATKYFNSTRTPRGKNVAELVDQMKNQGLKFAPATPGEEAAYTALYHALRNYEAAVQVAQQGQ